MVSTPAGSPYAPYGVAGVGCAVTGGVSDAGGEASPEEAWTTRTTAMTAVVTAVIVASHQIPIAFA